LATSPIAQLPLEIPFNWPQKTQKITRSKGIWADSQGKVVLKSPFFVFFVLFVANSSAVRELKGNE
jgi:hypothetical protein